MKYERLGTAVCSAWWPTGCNSTFFCLSTLFRCFAFQPLAAQILTRAAATRRWAPPAAPSRGSTWRRTAKRKRTERRLGWEFYCSFSIISSFTIIISELLILLTIQLLLVLVVNFHDAWRMWRARTQWPTWRPPLPESLARPTSSKTGKGSNSLMQKDNSFIFFIHC